MQQWSPTPDLQRALVVVAHPDDIDFGGAGTISAMVEAGMTVVYAIVTNGQSGTSDRHALPHHVGAMRQDEQREAARRVGVEQVIFLGHHDGRVVADLSLRRDISRVIRKVRPDILITASPERNYDRIFASHPDHLATGEAAVCAAYPDARDPHAHPELLKEEGLEPHNIKEVWLMGHGENNRFVNITSHIEKKIHALRAHVSQVSGRDNLDELITEWGKAVGEEAGLSPGRFAESFRVITIP